MIMNINHRSYNHEEVLDMGFVNEDAMRVRWNITADTAEVFVSRLQASMGGDGVLAHTDAAAGVSGLTGTRGSSFMYVYSVCLLTLFLNCSEMFEEVF